MHKIIVSGFLLLSLTGAQAAPVHVAPVRIAVGTPSRTHVSDRLQAPILNVGFHTGIRRGGLRVGNGRHIPSIGRGRMVAPGRPGRLPGRRYTEYERRRGRRSGNWQRENPPTLEGSVYQAAEALYIQYRHHSRNYRREKPRAASEDARKSRAAMLKAIRALRTKARIFQQEVDRNRDWPRTRRKKYDALIKTWTTVTTLGPTTYAYMPTADVAYMHGVLKSLMAQVSARHGK
jgi:hypothetical protein